MERSYSKTLFLFKQHRYGLAHIARVGSVALTMCITLERYYSVCHPMRQFESKSLLLPIAIGFAVVFNIPKFFELKLVTYNPSEGIHK